MKRLILMRHAKSDWSDLMATDHERSLNARGIASATALGKWLKDEALVPDHVMCSDAARTRETLALLNLSDVATTFTSKLYLADADVMARILAQQTADCVLMVAHNPGIATLAAHLLKMAPEHPQFDTYPTGATLVADFDIATWRELKMHSGTPVNFIVPRTLIE